MPAVTPVVRDTTTGTVRNAQTGETIDPAFLPSSAGSGGGLTTAQAKAIARQQARRY